MTTIVGIKTNAGEEAIVIAADTQLNISEDEKPTKKKVIRKIFTGDNWIMADEGRDGDDVRAFYSYISGRRSLESFLKVCYPNRDLDKFLDPRLFISPEVIERARQLTNGNGGKKTALEKRLLQEGDHEDPSPLRKHFAGMMKALAHYAKDPVTRAIMQQYFHEVNVLNGSYVWRTEDVGSTNDFVLGALTPHPLDEKRTQMQLLYVDEYGNVKRVNQDKSIEYVATGSGHEHAQEYIDDHKFNEEPSPYEQIDPGNVTIYAAINIALRAIFAAHVDPYSGGFDFAVLRRSGVKHHWKQIQQKMSDARDQVVLEYMAKYSTEEPKED